MIMLKKGIIYAGVILALFLPARGLAEMAKNGPCQVSDEKGGTKGDDKTAAKTTKSKSKPKKKGKKSGVSDEKGGTKKVGDR